MEEVSKRKPLRPSPRLIAFQGVEGEGEMIYYLDIDLRVLCGLQKFSKALIMSFFLITFLTKTEGDLLIFSGVCL